MGSDSAAVDCVLVSSSAQGSVSGFAQKMLVLPEKGSRHLIPMARGREGGAA